MPRRGLQPRVHPGAHGSSPCPRTSRTSPTIVSFAAANGLQVAPQRTGHNAEPLGAMDDVILVRPTSLRGVEIDVERRVARVRAGSKWEDVVPRASELGLAALHGSTPDVSVAGYSLGGGVGWYARKLGLSTNSVLAIELVTADGRLRRVDHEHEPELFWALRGGGGNFGVVTALEFQLYPIPEVYAGVLFFPWERSSEVLHAWLDWTRTVPEEVTSVGRILQFPPLPELPEHLRGRNFAVVEAVYIGDRGRRRRAARAAPALGPAMDTFAMVPPVGIAELHMDPPEPVPYTGEGMMLGELDATAIDRFVAAAGPGSGSPLVSAEIRHLGGALGPDGARGTARSPRSTPSSSRSRSGWCSTTRPTPRTGSSSSCSAQALTPYDTGRQYLNFTEEETDPATFYRADAYRRLRAVKAAVDPAASSAPTTRSPPTSSGAYGTGTQVGAGRPGGPAPRTTGWPWFDPSRREVRSVDERDLYVAAIGAGAPGEVAAGRLGEAGLSVAVVEERLVGGECSFSRLHALEGASPAGRARRRGAAGAGRSRSGELDVATRSRPPRRGRPRPRRLLRCCPARRSEASPSCAGTAGSTASGAWSSVPYALWSRAGRWSSRRGAPPRSPPSRASREAKPWTNIEATTAKPGAGKAVRPRRRRGRRRDGAGLVVARFPRDARPPRAAPDRAGGAVREPPRGRVCPPPRGRRRRAARDDGVLRRAERRGARRARATAPRSKPTRSSSRSDGTPRTADLGLETVGLDAGKAHRAWTSRSASRGRTGSTPSATSTDARCSRTWGSTRPARRRRDPRQGRFASARTAAASPRVIFTDPQVGAGRAHARRRGGGRVARADGRGRDERTTRAARSSGRNAPGTARLVVDEERGVVVGATITGSEVAEALHAATIAVVGEVPLDDLWHAVPSFPRARELWLRLLEAYGL